MNTNLIIILIVVALVGGFGFYLTTNSKTDEAVMTNSDDVMTEKDDAMMQGDAMKNEDSMEKDDAMMKDESMSKSDTMMSAGSYLPYNEDKLAMAKDGKVVLFFRASWCPTCRALDSNIKAHLSEIPSNVTILDVNYDDSTALKQKYGVTYQHTLVEVDENGEMITKWSGSPTLSALVSNIK